MKVSFLHVPLNPSWATIKCKVY